MLIETVQPLQSGITQHAAKFCQEEWRNNQKVCRIRELTNDFRSRSAGTVHRTSTLESTSARISVVYSRANGAECFFQNQVGILNGYTQSSTVLRALLAEFKKLFTCATYHGVVRVCLQRQDHDQDSLIFGKVVANQRFENMTFFRFDVFHIANDRFHILSLFKTLPIRFNLRANLKFVNRLAALGEFFFTVAASANRHGVSSRVKQGTTSCTSLNYTPHPVALQAGTIA